MRTLVNLSVVLSLALLPALVGCSERDNDGTVSPVDKNNVFDVPDGGGDFNSNNNFPPADGNNNFPPADDDAGVQPTGPLCTEASEGVSIWGVSGVCGYGTASCLTNCLNGYVRSRDRVQYNNCYDNCLANDSGWPAQIEGSGELNCESCLAYQQYKCFADYGCETQVDNLVCCASAGGSPACTNESSALNSCISGLGNTAEDCTDYGSIAYAICFN